MFEYEIISFLKKIIQYIMTIFLIIFFNAIEGT